MPMADPAKTMRRQTKMGCMDLGMDHCGVVRNDFVQYCLILHVWQSGLNAQAKAAYVIIDAAKETIHPSKKWASKRITRYYSHTTVCPQQPQL